MKSVFLILILAFSALAQAKEYKVFFKSEASDKRANIAEPDLIFLDTDDKVIFNSTNVDLDKIVVMQIDREGVITEASANTYRDLVDKSYLQTKDNCIYLYYSKQYLSSGAFGLSIVGELYMKQSDALKTLDYNQNFKDRVLHILKNLTPVDQPPPPVEE